MAMLQLPIGLTVERKLVTFLDGTTIGPAVCAQDPDDCCDPGSGPPGPPDPPPGPVVVEGCTEPYPGTIYGTWGAPYVPDPSCACYVGSFPLYHNGTAWVGTFRNCATPITATLTVGPATPPSPGRVDWSVEIESSFGTTGSTGIELACGEYPTWPFYIPPGDPCAGGVDLIFSA